MYFPTKKMMKSYWFINIDYYGCIYKICNTLDKMTDSFFSLRPLTLFLLKMDLKCVKDTHQPSPTQLSKVIYELNPQA